MTTTNAARGDVEVTIEELGDKFVSQSYAFDDGSTGVLRGKGLVLERFPALNPALAEFVSIAETVIEPASFKDYVSNFKSATAICRASLGSNQIVAVLDYHGRAREGERFNALPQRLAHTVTLLCPWDIDYKKWRDTFGKPLDQNAFANLLEDLVHTINEPAVADLAEAIDDLRIDRAVRFKSKVNRRNGTVQFAYEESEDGGDGEGGEVRLPEVVKIVVAMFQGGELVQIDAKLRYAIDKGKVFFTLAAPGIDKAERDQFRRIGEDVRAATGTPVFYTT